MLGPVASVAADPASERRNPGVEVPMPTLPSIINPPVGAAVVSYPLPKLPPPLTLNIDPGAVSPMPTLPVLVTLTSSVVPAPPPFITNGLFIVFSSKALVAPLYLRLATLSGEPPTPTVRNVVVTADGLCKLKIPVGAIVPMPTLPSIINPPVGAAVVSYPLPKLPPPLTLNFDPGAVSPMPTLPSIINPPVGAAVVLYPLPKLPPPLTLNFDPGAVSPMPTLPVVGLTTKYAGLAASCM